MKTIYLIRHGESESNVNHDLYFQKDLYDHTIKLSPKGKKQAQTCGKQLQKLLKDKSFSVFVSPYLRAQETYELIQSQLGTKPKELITDGRLREQEFKDYKNKEDWVQKKARAKARGKLYYRHKSGESGYDVLNRVGNFYNQLRFDLEKGNREESVVIVCHEIVIRCFLTLLLDLNPSEFETLYIDNCQILKFTASAKLKFKKTKV